jgi:PIN domain nuclease of toxin-antitoxin system
VNLLLDSHSLLWSFASPDALSPLARRAILSSSNRIYVSAASIWELSIKSASGKVDAKSLFAADLKRLLSTRGFLRLAISCDHALRAGQLPIVHKDPFDRMLAAQAQALNFPIISADAIFDRYGVQRIW